MLRRAILRWLFPDGPGALRFSPVKLTAKPFLYLSDGTATIVRP